MEKRLLPSLLAADFYNLSRELSAVEEAGVSALHLDLMDGHFVPNISFGPALIKKLRAHSDLFFDCHLMVEEPGFLLPALAEAGVSLVTVHWEACRHVHRILQEIHALGMKAGLALNPATPPQVADYLLDDLDLLLLMSVNPGFGGQKFIPSTLRKLSQARQMLSQVDREIILEVDGGITVRNAQAVLDTGCDWLVAGSSVFGGQGAKENASQLLEIIEK